MIQLTHLNYTNDMVVVMYPNENRTEKAISS